MTRGRFYDYYLRILGLWLQNLNETSLLPVRGRGMRYGGIFIVSNPPVAQRKLSTRNEEYRRSRNVDGRLLQCNRSLRLWHTGIAACPRSLAQAVLWPTSPLAYQGEEFPPHLCHIGKSKRRGKQQRFSRETASENLLRVVSPCTIIDIVNQNICIKHVHQKKSLSCGIGSVHPSSMKSSVN